MGLLNSGPKMRGVKFSQSGRDAGKQNALSLLLSPSPLLLRLSQSERAKGGEIWNGSALAAGAPHFAQAAVASNILYSSSRGGGSGEY